MYTCIVVITRPGPGHIVSGGSMCGTVVKDIAEKIYASSSSSVLEMDKVADDSAKVLYPEIKNGDYAALKRVSKELNVKTNESNSIKSQYVAVSEDNNKIITLKDLPQIESLVPNVVGMGVKDAVFALENCGLRVTLSGYGSVVSQSVKNGSKVVPGQTVALTLK